MNIFLTSERKQIVNETNTGREFANRILTDSMNENMLKDIVVIAP